MDLLNYFLFTITLLFAFLRRALYGITTSGPKAMLLQHLHLWEIKSEKKVATFRTWNLFWKQKNFMQDHVKITVCRLDVIKETTWPVQLLAGISEPESFDPSHERISINILHKMTKNESPAVSDETAPWQHHFS